MPQRKKRKQRRLDQIARGVDEAQADERFREFAQKQLAYLKEHGRFPETKADIAIRKGLELLEKYNKEKSTS